MSTSSSTTAVPQIVKDYVKAVATKLFSGIISAPQVATLIAQVDQEFAAIEAQAAAAIQQAEQAAAPIVKEAETVVQAVEQGAETLAKDIGL